MCTPGRWWPDYEDVIAVVDGYVQGLKHGSIDQLRGSFHADGIMYGHGPDGLLGGSIDNLYSSGEVPAEQEDAGRAKLEQSLARARARAGR